MSNMKQALMLLATVAILICMSFPVLAHKWDADQWAKDQLQLAEFIKTCAQLIKVNPEQFDVQCDGEELTNDQRLDSKFDASQLRLEAAIMKHTGMSIVDIQDLLSDFKDKDLGLKAIESIEPTSKYLNGIIADILRQARDRQQQEKFKQQYL